MKLLAVEFVANFVRSVRRVVHDLQPAVNDVFKEEAQW